MDIGEPRSGGSAMILVSISAILISKIVVAADDHCMLTHKLFVCRLLYYLGSTGNSNCLHPPSPEFVENDFFLLDFGMT
jgi:hypothetical protein